MSSPHERYRVAVWLRLAGWSYAAVGRAFGVTPQRAAQMVAMGETAYHRALAARETTAAR
jgi:hypothetical protein